MSDALLDSYWAAPPLARTAATITFGCSTAILLGIVYGGYFNHHPSYLGKFPPEIWRPVTCFIPTSPQLGLIFDTYFLYSYMAQLEVANPRFPRKADLVWYLMFICSTILCFASTTITVPGNEEDYPCTSDRPIIRKNPGWSAVWAWWDCYMDGSCDPNSLEWFFSALHFFMIDYFAGFGFGYYLRALIIAMVYTVTQDQRGAKSNFYFITIPAQLTPYCMILINLVFPNGVYVMLLQLEGLIAAHLWEFFSRIWPDFGGGPKLLATPNWISSLIKPQRMTARTFGTAIRPADQASGSSTGASRGPLPDSWRTRGPGHRLG